jgi:hypothetical protein
VGLASPGAGLEALMQAEMQRANMQQGQNRQKQHRKHTETLLISNQMRISTDFTHTGIITIMHKSTPMPI